MHRITITQFAYQPAVKDFVGSVTGVIDVDEQSATVRQGGDAWLDLRVMDFEAGKSVGWQDDPLRWAELLPDAIGAGGTEVSVEEVGRAVAEDLTLPDVASPALAALAAAVHYR